jgi:hypothetical protein
MDQVTPDDDFDMYAPEDSYATTPAYEHYNVSEPYTPTDTSYHSSYEGGYDMHDAPWSAAEQPDPHQPASPASMSAISSDHSASQCDSPGEAHPAYSFSGVTLGEAYSVMGPQARMDVVSALNHMAAQAQYSDSSPAMTGIVGQGSSHSILRVSTGSAQEQHAPTAHQQLPSALCTQSASPTTASSKHSCPDREDTTPALLSAAIEDAASPGFVDHIASVVTSWYPSQVLSEPHHPSLVQHTTHVGYTTSRGIASAGFVETHDPQLLAFNAPLLDSARPYPAAMDAIRSSASVSTSNTCQAGHAGTVSGVQWYSDNSTAPAPSNDDGPPWAGLVAACGTHPPAHILSASTPDSSQNIRQADDQNSTQVSSINVSRSM